MRLLAWADQNIIGGEDWWRVWGFHPQKLYACAYLPLIFHCNFAHECSKYVKLVSHPAILQIHCGLHLLHPPPLSAPGG